MQYGGSSRELGHTGQIGVLMGCVQLLTREARYLTLISTVKALKRILGLCQEPSCSNKGRRCFSERRGHATASRRGRARRYCLLHASRHGYCVICGVLSTKPDPHRKHEQMVICTDCSFRRAVWRERGHSHA